MGLGFFVISVSGQIVPKNPGFPGRETSIYREVSGKQTTTITTSLQSVTRGGTRWLEYHSQSNTREVTVKMDPDTLNGFYSEIWDRQNGSIVHSTNELVENKVQPGPDELLVTDMYCFTVTLRGFPWGQKDSAQLVFLRSRGSIAMEMKIKGKETLHIQGETYRCWKVQIGMGGFIGTILPKSYYWYSVQPPHYLVRSEESGMPGKPKNVLELQSYRSN